MRDRLDLLTGTPTGHRSLHSEMECDDSAYPLGDDLHQVSANIVHNSGLKKQLIQRKSLVLNHIFLLDKGQAFYNLFYSAQRLR